jgi:hypothetical protein
MDEDSIGVRRFTSIMLSNVLDMPTLSPARISRHRYRLGCEFGQSVVSFHLGRLTPAQNPRYS